MPRPRRQPAPDARSPTGGSERGARRRRRLIEAAVSLLEESGFEAVSHRAVAGRAGLPLAATTYYFRSREELVEAAIAQLGGAYVERARALAGELPPPPLDPARIATILVTLVAMDGATTDPARLLTFYERYVQAGRHPRLRPLVRAWTAELAVLAGRVLDQYGYGLGPNGELPRLIVAMIDGLLLDALVDADPSAPAVAAEGVASLLRRLAGAPDGGRRAGPGG